MTDVQPTSIITEAEFHQLSNKMKSFDAWVDANHRDKRTGWASYPSDVAKAREDYVDNDHRGLVEEYRWIHCPPDRAFLYPGDTTNGKQVVTNWTGIIFGEIIHRGANWRSNFGDRRESIRMRGTNGHTYAGTIYETYIRLRRIQ